MNLENKINQKLIIIAVIVIFLVSLLFCVILYFNKIQKINLNLSDFEIVETTDKCDITKISNEDNYLDIEGTYSDEIKKYKIYIVIENSNGEMKIYKTDFKKDEKIFYTSIRRKEISLDDTIKIIYMCDDEKLVISTNRTVGEANE